MAKNKTRRLWLEVLWKVPPGITKRKVRATLIKSIRNQTYRLPRSWRVVIRFRNKQFADMKTVGWYQGLRESAQSSEGFEYAVLTYLGDN